MVISVMHSTPGECAAPEEKKAARCSPQEISNVDLCTPAGHFFPSFI